MSILQAIYQFLFGPLELFFEVVYGVAFYIVDGNAGAAVIPLSLCLNFLLLPLYNRADAIQSEEHDRQQLMSPGVDHINRVFKGDERYMMLQAFYRVHAYKPLYALRSSLPLLLEIPFFVAAYHFLSNLADFHSTPFGPLANLAAPDGLLKLGSVTINLLPILMTGINILSSRIYAKDLSRKDKLQLYGMALIFLVLLYNSPSGLVFYWTLNNLFSLVKNLVNTARNRTAAACSAMFALGVAFLAYALFVNRTSSLSNLILILLGILLQVPLFYHYVLRRKNNITREPEVEKPKGKAPPIFIIGCLFLTLLTGVLIPSSVVNASPAEFVVLMEYCSPLWYVLSAFLLAAGTFLLWFGLFYYLARAQIRWIMEAGICVLSVCAVVDYMFFGTNLGNLSPMLQYDIDFHYSMKECLINIGVLLLVGLAVLGLWSRKKKIVQAVFPVLILAVAGMSVYNISGVRSELPQIKKLAEQEKGAKASFTFSRNGKNVVVFMLDRAISSYIPYLFQEKPELAMQFDGFTWYPNTLTFGSCTIIGSPSLFGGYEYTPEELNRRSSEALVDKHNEALTVLPVLFSEAGYEVTVCDPPYAGYTEIPDLSVFEGYASIQAYNTGYSQFRDQHELLAGKQKIWDRNFFCYSLMKVSPLIVQSSLYQGGRYFNTQDMDSMLGQTQFILGRSLSNGVAEDFLNSYSVLCALPEMTRISDDSQNAFLMMKNDTAHNVMMLQEPQYEPELFVDNTAYDAEHEDRFTIDGRTLLTDTPYKMLTYQSNMAALLRLGAWFDLLREQGVYDNTRIILVADHGYSMEQFGDMLFGESPGLNPEDVMAYNPLLMVKDFGGKGFQVDHRFMTNADTPALALSGLLEAPVNPFTGKVITTAAKNAEEYHIFYTRITDPRVNNGNTFLPGRWYALTGQNVFDTSAWRYLGYY